MERPNLTVQRFGLLLGVLCLILYKMRLSALGPLFSRQTGRLL